MSDPNVSNSTLVQTTKMYIDSIGLSSTYRDAIVESWLVMRGEDQTLLSDTYSYELGLSANGGLDVDKTRHALTGGSGVSTVYWASQTPKDITMTQDVMFSFVGKVPDPTGTLMVRFRNDSSIGFDDDLRNRLQCGGTNQGQWIDHSNPPQSVTLTGAPTNVPDAGDVVVSTVVCSLSDSLFYHYAWNLTKSEVIYDQSTASILHNGFKIVAAQPGETQFTGFEEFYGMYFCEFAAQPATWKADSITNANLILARGGNSA